MPSWKQPEATKGLNSSKQGGSSTFHACVDFTSENVATAATRDREKAIVMMLEEI